MNLIPVSMRYALGCWSSEGIRVYQWLWRLEGEGGKTRGATIQGQVLIKLSTRKVTQVSIIIRLYILRKD